MLNFSAFYPKIQKICLLVSDISFENDVEEVLHISSAAFSKVYDKNFVITTSTATMIFF
jgi:hypothetical protein